MTYSKDDFRKPQVNICVSANERVYLKRLAEKYAGGRESTLLRLLVELFAKRTWPAEAEEILATFTEQRAYTRPQVRLTAEQIVELAGQELIKETARFDALIDEFDAQPIIKGERA